MLAVGVDEGCCDAPGRGFLSFIDLRFPLENASSELSFGFLPAEKYWSNSFDLL